MPKSPEQFAKIRDERKNKILFAALRLFALYGYDSITINDITEEVQCSHGLFYHYFQTKANLWYSLVEEASKRISPFFIEHKNQKEKLDNGKAIEKIAYICQNFIQFIYQKDEFFPYFFYMHLNLKYQKTIPKPFQEKKEQIKIDPIKKMTALIARGQAEGDIAQGNPSNYLIFFFSSLYGLASLVIHDPEKLNELPNYQILMNIFSSKG